MNTNVHKHHSSSVRPKITMDRAPMMTTCPWIINITICIQLKLVPTKVAPPTLSLIGCPGLRMIKLGLSNDGFPPRHTEPHGTLSKFSRQRIAISTEERWSPVHLINYINIFRDVYQVHAIGLTPMPVGSDMRTGKVQ